MVPIRLQKIWFESIIKFFTLASLVFNETWFVQVAIYKEYDYQIRRLQCILFDNNQMPYALHTALHI